MPRGDGSGPRGMGPMTGRAAGFCVGYSAPGYVNQAGGRGMGFGGGGGGWGRGGGGRGWRNQFYATGLTGWQRAGAGVFNAGYPQVAPYPIPYANPPTKELQAEALKGQAEYLQNSLADIQKRIQELEAEKKQPEK